MGSVLYEIQEVNIARCLTIHDTEKWEGEMSKEEKAIDCGIMRRRYAGASSR
jgi:hypothetical protein